MRTQTDFSLPEQIDPSWRIGIVHSSYYKEEVEALVEGARAVLTKAGIKPENILLYPVPGSFEIPLIGSLLASKNTVDALIGLGIIVEGETYHGDILARESARGIMEVQLRTGIPFAYEILYVKNLEQAKDRSTGDGNKGGEAARAVVHSLAQIRKL